MKEGEGCIFEPKRFLVAGGSGFIGQQLCKRFLDQGHYVLSWDRTLTNGDHICADHPNFTREKRDVTIYADCWLVEKVDYVLHFASHVSPRDFLAHPWETLMANSEGTKNLIAVAFHSKARFLFSSSARIYRGEDPTQPRALYEQAKRFSEAMISHWGKTGLDARIVRMWQAYGPGCRPDDGHVIPTFIRHALKGEDIRIMGGNQLVSFTFIDDMIDGICRVLFSSETQPVDLGVIEQVSIDSLAKAIVGICGQGKVINTWEKLPSERVPDVGRARGLGWEPKVGLSEGLQKTVDYYRAKWFRQEAA